MNNSKWIERPSILMMNFQHSDIFNLHFLFQFSILSIYERVFSIPTNTCGQDFEIFPFDTCVLDSRRFGIEAEALASRTWTHRHIDGYLYTYKGLIIVAEYLHRGQSRPLPRESLTLQVVIIFRNFKQHRCTRLASHINSRRGHS